MYHFSLDVMPGEILELHPGLESRRLPKMGLESRPPISGPNGRSRVREVLEQYKSQYLLCPTCYTP